MKQSLWSKVLGKLSGTKPQEQEQLVKQGSVNQRSNSEEKRFLENYSVLSEIKNEGDTQSVSNSRLSSNFSIIDYNYQPGGSIHVPQVYTKEELIDKLSKYEIKDKAVQDLRQ